VFASLQLPLLTILRLPIIVYHRGASIELDDALVLLCFSDAVIYSGSQRKKLFRGRVDDFCDPYRKRQMGDGDGEWRRFVPVCS